MLNVKMLKGEMFLKGITNKELKELEIPDLGKLIERGSAPISVITKLAELIDKPVEFLLNDEAFYKKYVKLRNESICGTYKNINPKKIESRALKLGWNKSSIAPLVSDYENSFRYILYGSLNRLYGYEINNLCWLLDCSIDYLLDNSKEVGECSSLELLKTNNSTFKINSNVFRDYMIKHVELIKELNISKKYFNKLCSSNPYIPNIILNTICRVTKLSKEQLEYSEEPKFVTNSIIEENKIATSSNKILKERASYIREENKELKKNNDILYTLLQLSLNSQEVLDMFIRLSKLEDDDKKCILDTLEILLDRFDK